MTPSIEEMITKVYESLAHAHEHIKCLRQFPLDPTMNLVEQLEEWTRSNINEACAEQFHSTAYRILVEIMQVQSRSLPARCVKLESGMWELQMLVLEKWTRMKREFTEEQIKSMGFEVK